MAPKRWFLWTPVPLRFIVGAFLVWMHYTILLDATVRSNTIQVLTDLGIPNANLVVFGVAGIATFGGIALFLGLFTRFFALLITFSVGAHLIWALARGGFPLPADGSALPIPDIIPSFLLLAAMWVLFITGSGTLSIDAARGAIKSTPKYREESVSSALRFLPGFYLLATGVPMLLTAGGREGAVAVLTAIGIPMAGIVVNGVALISVVAALFMLLNFWPWIVGLLVIFSVGAHVVYAAINNATLAYPLPDMNSSIILLGLMFSLVVAELGRFMALRKRATNMINLMAPIKKGQEEAVRKVLAEIQADLAGNRYIRFPDSKLLHFARFIITRHKEGARLGFGATYNGPLSDLTDEIVRIAPGIEEIWGKCEGWMGTNRFYDFAKKNSTPSGMIYYGFPNYTVDEIRQIRNVSEQMAEIANRSPLALQSMIDSLEKTKIKPTFFGQLSRGWSEWRYGVAQWARKTFLPPAQELVRAIGTVDTARDWSRLTNNFKGDIERTKRELDEILDLEYHENQYAQTTMTVVADIKPGRTWILRALFLAAPPLLNYGWSRGDFAGVYSLHSFRFTLIDGGKRVWFMSNYNGSAENYFNDFIDKLNWGINAAYTHCLDYPEGGMNQQDAFAYWIRVRQLPALVYYSAYPDENIFRTIRDLKVHKVLATNFDRDDVEEMFKVL